MAGALVVATLNASRWTRRAGLVPSGWLGARAPIAMRGGRDAFWVLLRVGQGSALAFAIAVGSLAAAGNYSSERLFYLYALLPLAIAFVAEQLRVASAQTILDQRGLDERRGGRRRCPSPSSRAGRGDRAPRDRRDGALGARRGVPGPARGEHGPRVLSRPAASRGPGLGGRGPIYSAAHEARRHDDRPCSAAPRCWARADRRGSRSPSPARTTKARCCSATTARAATRCRSSAPRARRRASRTASRPTDRTSTSARRTSNRCCTRSATAASPARSCPRTSWSATDAQAVASFLAKYSGLQAQKVPSTHITLSTEIAQVVGFATTRRVGLRAEVNDLLGWAPVWGPPASAADGGVRPCSTSSSSARTPTAFARRWHGATRRSPARRSQSSPRTASGGRRLPQRRAACGAEDPFRGVSRRRGAGEDAREQLVAMQEMSAQVKELGGAGASAEAGARCAARAAAEPARSSAAPGPEDELVREVGDGRRARLPAA